MPGVPVLNPWAYCGGCGDPVDGRSRGQNVPCGCAAPVGSYCPTWAPDYGCCCAHQLRPARAEQEAAEALQEALEEQERALAPAPVEAADQLVADARRLKAYLSWAAFVVALLVLMALWTPGF
jgi:hypothetical protein